MEASFLAFRVSSLLSRINEVGYFSASSLPPQYVPTPRNQSTKARFDRRVHLSELRPHIVLAGCVNMGPSFSSCMSRECRWKYSFFHFVSDRNVRGELFRRIEYASVHPDDGRNTATVRFDCKVHFVEVRARICRSFGESLCPYGT